MLDDIAASRNIRFRWRTYTTSKPDPARMEDREAEAPAGFELTTAEKRTFTDKLAAWVQSQRKLLEQDCEAMYADIIKAFPIDEFCAAERTEEPTAIKPEN